MAEVLIEDFGYDELGEKDTRLDSHVIRARQLEEITAGKI